MRRGPECGLGDADDGRAELGMNMRAEARSARRIQVDVSIHHDERERPCLLADRPDRRELAHVELTWNVLFGFAQEDRRGARQFGEPGIPGGHECGPRASRPEVVDIHCGERAPSQSTAVAYHA